MMPQRDVCALLRVSGQALPLLVAVCPSCESIFILQLFTSSLVCRSPVKPCPFIQCCQL